MSQQTKTNEYELHASEFSWEIAPGKTIRAWGFNQQLPGPTLKAHRGDTLVVKVINNLEEPTTIHWHGIRLPATMDGTGEVQMPIQPGESFEYRFTVPDAGTFWYHSHINETEQMERGLYGALVVSDDRDPVMDDDRVMVIDDMKLTESGEFKIGSFLARFKERHDGRQGDILLINGRETPTIHMAAGQRERWRFINASSARYFVLHLAGKPFAIIGSDGGLLEQPVIATQALITPGERMDIVAGPFSEGEVFSLESLPYNRMTFLKAHRDRFATIQVGTPQASKAFIPEVLRTIEPLAPQNAPITRKVKLSVGASLKHGLDFLVNDQLHAHDAPVKVGELQVWEVTNSSLMDHPFHLHGFFFQVLEANGVAPVYRAWKDTVNLPPRTTIKIAWIPDNRPGRWMYHCHILEHHAAGMMAHFEVVANDQLPETPAAGGDHHSHAPKPQNRN